MIFFIKPFECNEIHGYGATHPYLHSTENFEVQRQSEAAMTILIRFAKGWRKMKTARKSIGDR